MSDIRQTCILILKRSFCPRNLLNINEEADEGNEDLRVPRKDLLEQVKLAFFFFSFPDESW